MSRLESDFDVAATKKTGRTRPPLPYGAAADFAATMPEQTPVSHGATGEWQPPFIERAKDIGESLLPSFRTAAQVGGGIVGGALAGPPGIVPGVLAGEAVHQLGQHYIGSPEAPQTSNEAAWRLGEAGVTGMLQYGIPWLAHYQAEHPMLPAMRRTLFRTPQTLVTRALSPSDTSFQNHVGNALSELKTGQATILKADNPVQAARDVLEQRTQGYNAIIKNKIVKPQANMPVLGSGTAIADAQIKAIPTDLQQSDPTAYQRLVEKANLLRGQDLTIGTLDKMRTELNATQSVHYGRDLSGQLTMEAGPRNMDIARGNAVRRLFYHGLDNYGLGGGADAAAINQRIGSNIHMNDALSPKINTAVAQKMPLGQRTLLATGRVLSPSKWGTGTRPVADDLKLAIQRWNNMPQEITPRLERPVRTVTGAQPTLPMLPGPLGAEQLGSKGEYLTPELEYMQLQRQREVWRAGAPSPPPKGQLEMFPGGPPKLFPPMEEGITKPKKPKTSAEDYLRTIGSRNTPPQAAAPEAPRTSSTAGHNVALDQVSSVLSQFPKLERVDIATVHRAVMEEFGRKAPSKEQINDALEMLETQGKLVRYRKDLPTSITPEDLRFAPNVGGEPRHILYIR